MKTLLRAKGILKEDEKSVDILQPKPCPNCRELNRIDAQFCQKCNFIMSFEGYQKAIEERQRKDQEVQQLKEQMSKMHQDFESYDRKVKDAIDKFRDYKDGQIRFYKGEFERYREIFGPRPLTKGEWEKLKTAQAQLEERIRNNPDDSYDDPDYTPDDN